MSCCLKNYAKKTVVLTPLTPLTSELAKLELFTSDLAVLHFCCTFASKFVLSLSLCAIKLGIVV